MLKRQERGLCLAYTILILKLKDGQLPHLTKNCWWVNKIIRSRIINSISKANITVEAASTLIHAFISSKVNNMNSVLIGLAGCLLKNTTTH